MDITEFTERQGEFLKAENLEGETLVSIENEAIVKFNEKYKTERLHIPIMLKENKMTFDCSKTNARTIAEKLGTDTTQWIGKELVLEKYKTKTSDGTLVDAINVKEVRV